MILPRMIFAHRQVSIKKNIEINQIYLRQNVHAVFDGCEHIPLLHRAAFFNIEGLAFCNLMTFD